MNDGLSFFELHPLLSVAVDSNSHYTISLIYKGRAVEF
jgi:hypothetical protein